LLQTGSESTNDIQRAKSYSTSMRYKGYVTGSWVSGWPTATFQQDPGMYASWTTRYTNIKSGQGSTC
jgi:hypothetical protein